MLSIGRVAFLAASIVASGGAVQAAPFVFSLDNTFTNGSVAAGISAGDSFSLQVVVDNGGSTAQGQQWFQADVLSATLTSGSYVATFNAPFYFNDPLFVTDASGVITTASWYDTDDNNTDTIGPGSPEFLANALWLSNAEALYFTELVVGPGKWSVEAAVSDVPLPAGGLLLLSGLGALAYVRRRMA